MSGPSSRNTPFDFAAAARSCSRSAVPILGISRSITNLRRVILLLRISSSCQWRFDWQGPAFARFSFPRNMARNPGPTAGLGFEFDPPPMQLNELLHKRQTDARPRSRYSSATGGETVEHRRHDVRRYAGPGIGDIKLHVIQGNATAK